jgi:hypothetical protein
MATLSGLTLSSDNKKIDWNSELQQSIELCDCTCHEQPENESSDLRGGKPKHNCSKPKPCCSKPCKPSKQYLSKVFKALCLKENLKVCGNADINGIVTIGCKENCSRACNPQLKVCGDTRITGNLCVDGTIFATGVGGGATGATGATGAVGPT